MSARLLPLSAELQSTWWALWRADPRATPFQSPAWLVPWAEQFAGDDAWLLAIGDPIAALLPIYRHKERWLLWGAGTSDWLDGVFSTRLDAEELRAGLAMLPGPLDLFQLPAGSPLLAAAKGRGVATSDCCVGLALPAELPHNMAQNLAYYRRRAERELLSPPRRAGPEIFDALVELHRHRWAERHDPGVLADPLVLAWHRAALPLLAAEDLLRLYVVERGDRPVGVLYMLSGESTASYYIGGFDPEFAGCGVGTILIGHAIAEAEREGREWFDFLRGEEPYKYHWGATNTPTYAALLEPAELALARA